MACSIGSRWLYVLFLEANETKPRLKFRTFFVAALFVRRWNQSGLKEANIGIFIQPNIALPWKCPHNRFHTMQSSVCLVDSIYSWISSQRLEMVYNMPHHAAHALVNRLRLGKGGVLDRGFLLHKHRSLATPTPARPTPTPPRIMRPCIGGYCRLAVAHYYS